MSEQSPVPPPSSEVEQPKEKLFPPKFDQVRIGHPLRGFDRDQAVALFIASKAQLITDDADISFTPFVDTGDLASETTLALEGFSPHKTVANNHEGSNFTNNPKTDAPAASELLQAYSRRFDTMVKAGELDAQTFKQIKELSAWVKAVETGKPVPSPKELRLEDLEYFTQVFYAIKYDIAQNQDIEDKAGETVRQVQEIFETMFQKDGTALEQKYADVLARYEQKRDADFKKLNERIVKKNSEGKEELNSDHVKVTQTLNGFNLTYVDVSGLDVESGGVSVATSAVKRLAKIDTHIVVLVDDEKDDQGNVLGKAIKIKIPKEMADHPRFAQLDLRELAMRLNLSEKLFGGGVNLLRNADFDGHPQVIGSPAWVGSQMEPGNVFIALQEYFDVPRYDEEQFASKVQKLAQKIDCDHYDEEIIDRPDDEYAVAQRSVLFRIPTKTGEYALVKINEQDIPLYEHVLKLTDDQEHNREVLLEKTDFTESGEISTLREQLACISLERYIQEGNVAKILSIIDDLNPATIQNMEGDLLMRAFGCISSSSEGIAQVWDKDNLRFKTSRQFLPEWARPEINLEQFKAARFDYLFLQKKVDSFVVGALQEFIVNSGDVAIQEKFGEMLVSIATSDTYKQSHLDVVHDRLVQSILHFAADKRIDSDKRKEVLSSFVSHYGVEMSNHWRALTVSDEPLLNQIRAEFGNIVAPVLEQVPIVRKVDVIPGVPKSYVVHPDEEAMYEILQRQEATKREQIITVLTEIGRPITNSMKQKGIITLERDRENQFITEKAIDFSAIVKTEGFLRLDRQHRDQVKVALAIGNIVKEIAAVIPKDTKIRIIRGSFPGLLVSDLSILFSLDPEIVPLRERIIICDFNQQLQQFEDSPVIHPEFQSLEQSNPSVKISP